MMFFVEKKVSGAQLYQSNHVQEEIKSLVSEYAPLVKRIAEQIKWKIPEGIELDDLIQSGIIGLLEAKSQYDAQHQTSFKTYATIKVRFAIYEAIRKHTGITRELSQNIKQILKTTHQLEQSENKYPSVANLTQKLGVTHQEYAAVTEEMNVLNASSFEELTEEQVPIQQQSNPFLCTASEEVRTQLRAGIQELTYREQLILSLYYNQFLGFREIAVILQLTEARISQIHAQLLIKLKSKLDHLTTIQDFQ